MTGFIIKPRRDCVEIATDGAVYTPDGVLLGSRYKVRTSDHIPLAIVGSGTVSDTDMVADLILEAAEVTRSVDEAIALLAGSLKTIERSRSERPHPDETANRIAIATISETHGPTSFVFDTFQEYGSDLPSFELRHKPLGFGQGALPTGEELVAEGVTLADGLKKHAVFFFEHMRHAAIKSPVGPGITPFCSIGCHVDFTTVSADGYTVERLHIWPDVIGEKIDPSALDRQPHDQTAGAGNACAGQG